MLLHLRETSRSIMLRGGLMLLILSARWSSSRLGNRRRGYLTGAARVGQTRVPATSGSDDVTDLTRTAVQVT